MLFDIEVRPGPNTGHFQYYTETVEAATSQNAVSRVQRANPGCKVQCTNSYNAPRKSGGGGGTDLSLDQTTGLVLIGGGLLAFFTLTPFIMSGLLGAAGTWGAGKATNYSLQEYADTNNPSDNDSKKALTILVSAIVLGTIGFGWGSNIQKGFSTNSNTSMIENIRKA